MPPIVTSIAIGVGAGLAASLAMNLYQGAAAHRFGQDKGNDDPATVKAADSVTRTLGAGLVTQKRRAAAGNAVHYATGAALGGLYGAAVRGWPPAAAGFGMGFGVAVALVLDDALVPAFGWGVAPWKTDTATQAYGLTSHAVFGLTLEGVRRASVALLT